MDEPCTPEQIDAIRRAALARARHFRELADALDNARADLENVPGWWTFTLLEESAAQLRQLGEL